MKRISAGLLTLLLASAGAGAADERNDTSIGADAAEKIKSACHGFLPDMLPESLTKIIYKNSLGCQEIQSGADVEDVVRRYSGGNTTVEDIIRWRETDYSHDPNWKERMECRVPDNLGQPGKPDHMCVTVRLQTKQGDYPVNQATYDLVAQDCDGEYYCIEGFFQEWPRKMTELPEVEKRVEQKLDAQRLDKPAEPEVEKAGGIIDMDKELGYDDAAPETVRLSIDDMLAGQEADTSEQPETTLDGLDAMMAGDQLRKNVGHRADTTLDNIEEGRHVLKVEHAQSELAGRNARMRDACGCVQSGSSCWNVPSLSNLPETQALHSTMQTYHAETTVMCKDWAYLIGQRELTDLTEIDNAIARIDRHLARVDAMGADVNARIASVRNEERRIADAKAAQAAEQARAQKKTGRGLLAGLATMTGGAVIANNLGIEIDPDALSKVSVDVARSVENGEGVGAALGKGLQGMQQFVDSSTQLTLQSRAEQAQWDAAMQQAKAQVKVFPAPGEQPAAPVAMAAAPAPSPYDDLLSDTLAAPPEQPAAPPAPPAPLTYPCKWSMISIQWTGSRIECTDGSTPVFQQFGGEYWSMDCKTGGRVPSDVRVCTAEEKREGRLAALKIWPQDYILQVCNDMECDDPKY